MTLLSFIHDIFTTATLGAWVCRLTIIAIGTLGALAMIDMIKHEKKVGR